VKLRYYQTAAVRSVFAFFRSKEAGHPLIELPTGSGKSHVLASIIEEARKTWKDIDILVLSHTQEIIEQDFSKIVLHIDRKLVGIYSSGLGSKVIRPVTIAGIQSAWRKPELFKHFKIIIVDECHTIPPKGIGMYRTFFAGISNYKVVGLTATPWRTGFGKLTDPGHLFKRIVYRADIDTLIRQGYLAPLISKAADYQMDPTKERIKVNAGDYVVKQLAESFDQTKITNKICTELAQYKSKRKHWLVFAIDIEHAEHIAEQLSLNGISACYVHSKLKGYEREEIINLFRQGVFQALVNVAVLTTGFDYPCLDLIALLRPTRSPVLHVQMIGRGSRIADGKTNCLILDFAGNLQRLGPVNSDFEFKAGTKGGDAPTKVCPKCSEVLYLSAKICDCGFEFKFKTKLTLTSSDSSILKKVVDYEVSKVYYHRHIKDGKPDSLKVTYVCGTFKRITEWVPLENPIMRARSEHWWKVRSGRKCPKTVTLALEKINDLDRPKQISVEESGKYPKIQQYHFENRSSKICT